MAMSSVPEDICVEIFLRLPVKSLRACKCVCKTWFELISAPSFIKLHLTLTAQKKNPIPMLKMYDKSTETYGCNSIICDSVSELVVVQIELPLRYFRRPYFHDVDLVGSCNGLICFWNENRNCFCIWNPATKEYKKIPESGSYPRICAFGYDCRKHDYKIINVERLAGIEDNCIVRVYTLGTNSWRCSKTVLDGSRVKLFHGVLVDGASHWLNEKMDKIISMDISDEKFEELQLPKEVLEKQHSSITMGDFEGCLALVVDFKIAFEVWVMQEYGVPESWTKRYVIKDEKLRYGSCIRLMCSLKNGEYLVLVADYKLVVYDTIKHSCTSKLRMPYTSYINYDGRAVSYFESLVSLNSGTYVRRKKKKIKFNINPFKLFCT